MNKKNKGNSTVQYVLILSLVAGVIVPVLFSLGGDLENYFKNYAVALNDNNKQAEKSVINLDAAVKNGSLRAGALGGTSELPKAKCIDGMCSIDFGKFVFNSVPENFKEFVETSGFSGGTKQIAAMLDQVAANADNIDSSVDVDLIKQLAQQGHVLADFEKSLETSAQAAIDDPSCDIKNTFIVPANYLTKGSYRNDFEKTLALLQEALKNSTGEDTEELKKLIAILSAQILTLADTMGTMGSEIKGNNFTAAELEAILHPEASTITNIDSAIICIEGDGFDSGTACR